MEVDRIGIGTGSTVAQLIEALPSTGINPSVIASSSLASALMLAERGYVPVHPSVAPVLDVYIDGADEVDPKGNLVKGRGAALLGEKILASRSRLNIFIVTREKLVSRLGSRRPIPVEVVKDALTPVVEAIRRRFPDTAPRTGGGKDGPVISDWGGVIVDVHTGPLRDPLEVEGFLCSIPGVVETGLFIGYTDYVVVGRDDCGWEVLRFERAHTL
ncbi:MAG: ribose 5-phosphate isomerase A [Desulfurococcales archaeon]|nr:ribose 5-phosphate isomerase A [Desulfurococcales archaeon]